MAEIAEIAGSDSLFVKKFKGNFSGILRWHEFDAFWETLALRSDEDWYIYKIGDAPPETTSSVDQFTTFIAETSQFLRVNHKEKYCGVVYVDDVEEPSFIKIFHPKNLGFGICSIVKNTPLPGWILSRVKPVDLAIPAEPAGIQFKWWNKIIHAF